MRTIRFASVILVIVSSLFLSSAIPAHADPAALANPIVIGQIGGVTKVVAYDEDNGYLFFNVGPRLARMTLTAADPAHPVQPAIYSAVLPGIPEDIELSNGYLYVALGEAGIAIVDPLTLQLASVEELPEDMLGINFTFELFASDLAIGARYLYVAVGRAGILAYDLGLNKNTLTFMQAKTFLTPVRNITDIEVQAPATQNGFRESLFAAANNSAADPTLRGGVLKFDTTNTPILGTPVQIREQIEVNALAVSSSYLYAAGQTALYVLATSDLSVQNSDFPLSNPPVDLLFAPDGNTAYLLNTIGIDVVDLHSPTAPVALTAAPFATPGAVIRLAPATFAGLAEIYLFVADFDAGLSIVRAPSATPANLELVSPSYVVSNLPIARAVAAAFGQAFSAGMTSSLQTVQSSAPGALRFVGTGVTTPAAINALAVQDSWLVAAAGTSGLLRFAIQQGAEPGEQESFTTGGVAADLAIVWPNAIVADGAHGLVVVNLDGPLTLTGFAAPPQFNSNFRSVDAAGNYAYVVDANGSFRIYDLTDPTGPIALGTLSLPGALDVRVHGNFAFLACGEDGLRIVDVTDPNAPVFVGTEFTEVAGLAQQLEIYQEFLLVAAADAGIHMLAIQPDGQLVPVRTIKVPGDAVQLDMGSDGYLYAAIGDGGIAMVQFEDFHVFIPVIGNGVPVQQHLPFVGK